MLVDMEGLPSMVPVDELLETALLDFTSLLVESLGLALLLDMLLDVVLLLPMLLIIATLLEARLVIVLEDP